MNPEPGGTAICLEDITQPLFFSRPRRSGGLPGHLHSGGHGGRPACRNLGDLQASAVQQGTGHQPHQGHPL